MSIVDGRYVNPGWNNNAPPTLDASNLNDISNTLEKLDVGPINEQAFKVGDVLITQRNDLPDNWTLANGDRVEESSAMYPLAKQSYIPCLTFFETNCNLGISNNTKVVSTAALESDQNYFYVYKNTNGAFLYKVNKQTGLPTTVTSISPLTNASVADRKGVSPFPTIINGRYMFYVVDTSGNGTMYIWYSDTPDVDSSWTLFTIPKTTYSQNVPNIQYVNGQWVIWLWNFYNGTTNVEILYGEEFSSSMSSKTITYNFNLRLCPYFVYRNGKYRMFYETVSSTPYIGYYTDVDSIDELTNVHTGTFTTNNLIFNNTSNIYETDNYIYVNSSYDILIIDINNLIITGFPHNLLDFNTNGDYGQPNCVIYNGWYVLSGVLQGSNDTVRQKIVRLTNDGAYLVYTGDRGWYDGAVKLIITPDTISGVSMQLNMIAFPSLPEISVVNAYAYIKTED